MTKAMTDSEYNEAWLARVFARCERSESGCLLWRGSVHTKGYAQTVYRLRTVRVHRKVYELVNNVKLTPDVLVCHRCDVRNCIEPNHMWLGSNDDNQLDAWLKGRKRMQSATHCGRGHEYTPENTRRYGKTARRTCLKCQRARTRIAAGWPEELAWSVDVVPAGYSVGGGKWRR